jgi:hypothetical protein
LVGQPVCESDPIALPPFIHDSVVESFSNAAYQSWLQANTSRDLLFSFYNSSQDLIEPKPPTRKLTSLPEAWLQCQATETRLG